MSFAPERKNIVPQWACEGCIMDIWALGLHKHLPWCSNCHGGCYTLLWFGIERLCMTTLGAVEMPEYHLW